MWPNSAILASPSEVFNEEIQHSSHELRLHLPQIDFIIRRYGVPRCSKNDTLF